MVDADSFACPPRSVRVAQVVLVECERGAGDARRAVLQVWSLEGVLLAEHDRIHPDPIYAACFLRDLSTPELRALWSSWPGLAEGAQAHCAPALARQTPAAINSEALEVANV